MQLRGMSCCGWQEIESLSSWNGTTKEFNNFLQTYLRGNKPPCGSVIFTANVAQKNNYADKLAALITKYDLGTITEIPRFTNPNTGRTITTYCWTFNHERIKEYLKTLFKDAVARIPVWK